MIRYSYPVAMATLLTGLLAAPWASAQDATRGTTAQPAASPVVVAPAPGYGPRDTVLEDRLVPNTELIAGGALLLGVTYGTSVVVAATSDRDADDSLYVPIAGPWINLAERGGCDSRFDDCTAETLNKVLLVADGIFQGVGALQIVGGFVFPKRQVVLARTASKPSVHVAPMLGASRIGLGAAGRF